MREIGPNELDLLQCYFEGKKVYDGVFPELYDAIAEHVKDILAPQFPEVKPVIGPRDKARAMKKQPHLGENVPIDWVAFGFHDMDLYDFHVGCVFDLDDWPITYQMGLHVLDEVYGLAEKEIKSIEWTSIVGLDPTYRYVHSIREHQWVDPVRELNFAELEGEVEKAAERVAAYCRAAKSAARVMDQRLLSEK
jgi:hypothetical protein